MMKIIHFLFQTRRKIDFKDESYEFNFQLFTNFDLRFKRSVSKVTILPHNHL